MTDAPDPVYIRRTRVVRMPAHDCAPLIAIGLESLAGDLFFFSMADAEVYDFMRRLKHVLFDVDPPRSGAGSPEASASS